MSNSCDWMDCSLEGSSVHGISQARMLECIVISFSRWSSWPRDQIWVSYIAGRFFTIWATRNTPRDAIIQTAQRHHILGQSPHPHICPTAMLQRPNTMERNSSHISKTSNSWEKYIFFQISHSLDTHSKRAQIQHTIRHRGLTLELRFSRKNRNMVL